MADQLLANMRVLIVEDEMLVMMSIEDMMTDLGCTQIARASTVDEALIQIRNRPFDAATLDVNLNGTQSYAVAEALVEHGIPFAFSTGYGARGMADAYRDWPVLDKPFNFAQMTAVMTALVAPSIGDSSALAG